MRMKLTLALGIASVFLLGACGGSKGEDQGTQQKPGCRLLYKRYDRCQKMPLTEEAFIKLCEKMKNRARTKAEIACSTQAECGPFKKCVKAARQAGRKARMHQRWKEAMAKAKQGRWASVRLFCKVWKKDLDADLKKQCDEMPERAVAAMTKDITAKRDRGQVGFKEVRCYDLKRYAKEAGPDKLRAATTLCKEVQVARDLAKAKAEVAKQLKQPRPYLPYYCGERKLEEIQKVGTPFANKTLAQMYELCFKKLGKVIFAKKVPKMKFYCNVRTLYHVIQRFQVHDPELDKWMQKVKAKCEKK